MSSLSSFGALLALHCALLCLVRAQIPRFRVVKEWNYLNFTWPTEESLLTAMAKGTYIPENNLMAGVNYYEDYYYLAMPRMRNGVPVTLGRIKMSDVASPLIEPFPSWEMNNLGDCNALQNVQNLEIDAKGLAWIIDIGRTSTLSASPSTACSPKLVIFDIKNNRTTTIYTFPEDVASRNSSYLYDIVVDDADAGYAYITDNSGKDPGIIVYSAKENRSWKVRHSKTMRADPNITSFRVNGVEISSSVNIAGIALGPKARANAQNISLNRDRDVYYCPISSLHLYSISSSVLTDESKSGGGDEYEGFVRDVGIKSSQTDGMMMDNKGVLYYSLLSTSSIAVWDSSKSFVSSQRVIARDPKYIQWPNSFAFDDRGNVVALTNRLQMFIYDKMNLDEANFRLLQADTGGKSYVYDDEKLVYSTNAAGEPATNQPERGVEEKKANISLVEESKGKEDANAASKTAPESKEEHITKPEPNATAKDDGVVVKSVASSATNFVISVVTVMFSTCLVGRS